MSGKCRMCDFFNSNRCLGRYHGLNVSDTMNDIKDCYYEGTDAMAKRINKFQKANAVRYNNAILSNFKIDGRKLIYLQDLNNHIVQIRVRDAMRLFGNLCVVACYDSTYYVNYVFNNAWFMDSDMVRI